MEKQDLLLKTQGEVVHTSTCTEEQQDFLLLVKLKESDQLAHLLVGFEKLNTRNMRTLTLAIKLNIWKMRSLTCIIDLNIMKMTGLSVINKLNINKTRATN